MNNACDSNASWLTWVSCLRSVAFQVQLLFLKEIVVPTYAEQRPTPKSIAAYVKSNAARARKAQRMRHRHSVVTREAEYKGHHIWVQTTYQASVDGRPLMINVVLLMRFPYHDARRLVLVQTISLKGVPGGVAPANFLDWRREARSFEYLSAKIDWSGYELTGPEGPEQVVGVPVTAGIFEVVGVRPQLGRTFGPRDDHPESDRVAILSDQLWTTRYTRDRAVVGRTITLNGLSYTVVGVMPPDFYLNREMTMPANVDRIWVPLASQFGMNPSTSGMLQASL